MDAIALIWYFFTLVHWSFGNPSLNPDLLSKEIQNLTAETLRTRELQAYFDTLVYDSGDLDGKILLNTLVASFEKKFQDRIAAVRNLRAAIVKAHTTTTASLKACCEFQPHDVKFDSRFKQKVSTYSVCEKVSSRAAPNATRLQRMFLDACKENLGKIPSLKWQYFGSEQGVTTQFPSAPTSDCNNYDSRFRPWYVEANVPTPKQVVIAIDISVSMRDNTSKMKLAREAAKNVINTLNPKDSFAVLGFSSTVHAVCKKCFSKVLAQATPKNKQHVSEFVDSLIPGGGTAYLPVLEKAFDYFDDEVDDDRQDRVILFLSDGKPQENATDIYELIKQNNAKLKKPVVIMTYGIGNSNFSVLEKMAKVSGGSNDEGVDNSEEAGIFTVIEDSSNIRNQMAAYYEHFTAPGLQTIDPIWTVPYLDGWGLGVMITANLPVYGSGGHLLGVAAVDTTIEELLAESTYFKPNQLSYSFVINEAGLVINHPLMPHDVDVDPLFVLATAFERDPEFLFVFESMIKGKEGKKMFNSTRILSKGDSSKYGVRQVKVQSTYFWKQIPNTKFSVCLVLADNEVQSILTPQAALARDSFLYHRLDLKPPQVQCSHCATLCSQDQSSVYLAARAFEDPELHISQLETINSVESLTRYMEGNISSPANNLRSGIRDIVVATKRLDDIWRTNVTAVQQQVVWRFLGTNEGVLRLFPGCQVPANLDPVLLPWYSQTSAQNGKVTVTLPTVEGLRYAPSVISFSQVLFERRMNKDESSRTDKIAGVLGVHILTSYVRKLFLEQYPVCNNYEKYRCLVIDNAGYIIFTGEQDRFLRNVTRHIAEEEPEMTISMIRDGIFMETSCSNIADALLSHSYQVLASLLRPIHVINVNAIHFLYTTSSDYRRKIPDNQQFYTGVTGRWPCRGFEVIPVASTNLFILLLGKKSRYECQHGNGITCNCSNWVTPCMSIWSTATRLCECPCSLSNPYYHTCNNSFSEKGPPPCTPKPREVSWKQIPDQIDNPSLPKCYDVVCAAQQKPSAVKLEKDRYKEIVPGVLVPLFVIILCVALFMYWRVRTETDNNTTQPKIPIDSYVEPMRSPNNSPSCLESDRRNQLSDIQSSFPAVITRTLDRSPRLNSRPPSSNPTYEEIQFSEEAACDAYNGTQLPGITPSAPECYTS